MLFQPNFVIVSSNPDKCIPAPYRSTTQRQVLYTIVFPPVNHPVSTGSYGFQFLVPLHCDLRPLLVCQQWEAPVASANLPQESGFGCAIVILQLCLYYLLSVNNSLFEYLTCCRRSEAQNTVNPENSYAGFLQPLLSPGLF